MYLADRLANAKSYKRIAGYFRSSILELVGEEIAGIPDVRIVCNSDLDVADIAVSKAARAISLKAKFNEGNAELEALLSRDRYRKLYDLLRSGNVQIRVLPKEKVFLHG
ncbi:MAG TPA: DEAD/DEAH box helicase, partial [Phycisphaerales bacterium]|nr:DEAD/DEAH box helicase [Phycisphaerales bacterium]